MRMVVARELHPSLVRFRDALSCVSYTTNKEVVAPPGNAPGSSAYQAAALLLSYGAEKAWRKGQDSNLHARLRTDCFQDSCR
jgi:hypothetical protein